MYLSGISQRATTAEIAEFFGISKDHLAKVAQRLTRLGYIRSVRGIGGGIELAQPADKVRIGEVVQQMEGTMHLLDCVASQEQICVIQPGCQLRLVLAEAERIQLEYLNSVTLADIAKPGIQLVSISPN
jgi:Rrf2 family transcriptional regulator, nitric oxide-sensitive transcriptional repressor